MLNLKQKDPIDVDVKHGYFTDHEYYSTGLVVAVGCFFQQISRLRSLYPSLTALDFCLFVYFTFFM